MGTDYDDFKKSRLFAGGNSIINKYKRDIITELKEYNYSTAHIKHFFTQLINNDDSTIKALQKQSKLLAEERKFIDDLYQDKEDITVLTKKDYSELCNILTSSDIDLKNKIKDPLLKEYIHYSLIQNYDKTDTKDIVEAIKATIENCPQSGKCGITQKILDKASKGDIQNFVSLTYQLNKIYGNNFVIINQYLKNKFATDNTYDIQKASKDLVKMAVGIIFNRQYNIAANFDTISLDIEDARINDDIIKDTIKSLVELNEKDITDINSFKAVYDELSTKLLDKSVELKMEDTAVASPDIYAKFVQTELRQIYSDQFSSTKAPELTSYNIDNYDDVKKVVEECYKVIVLPQINSKPNATFNEYHNILETYIANIKEYIVNCVNEDKSVDKNTIINTCLPNLETFLKLELKDNAGQPLFTVDDIKLLSNESCQNIIKNCTTQSKETDGNKSAIGKSILQNKFLLSSDNAKDSTLYDDIITIISNANLDKAQTFVTSINSSAEFEAVKELCQLYTGIQKYIEDAAIDDAIKNEFNRIYLAIVVASINADKTPQDVLKDLRESVDFKEIYAKLATIKYYRNAYSDIGKNVAVNPLPEEIVTAVKNTLQEKDISIEKFNSIAVLLDNSSNLTFKEDDIKTIKYKDYKKYKLSDNKSVSQYIVKNSDYKDYFDRLVVEKPGLFDIQDANTLETVQTKVKDSQLFLLFKDIYDSVVVIDEKDKNNFKQKIITIINTLYDEHDVDGSRTKINNVIKVLNDSFSDIQGKEKCERVVKFFGALAGTDLENAIKAVSSQDTDAYIYSDSYEEGKKIIEAFNLADKKVQVASKEKIEELKKIQGCLEGTAIVQADIDNKPIDDLITANKGKIFENVLNDLLDTAVGSEFASGENQDTLKTQLFSSGLIYQMNATTIGKIKGKNGPAKITTFKALNDFEDEGGNKPFINISKNVEELSYEKIFELKTNVAVISKVKEKLADTTEFGGAATDDDAKNCIEILNIIYNSGTDKEKKEPFIDISGGTKISQIKIKNAEDLKYIIDERNGAPVDFDKRLNDITTYISGENLLTILQKKVSISDLHTQLMGVLDTDDKKKTISENKKYFNNILFNTLNDVDDTNKLDKLKRSIEIATDSIILTDNFISDGVKNAIYDKGQYGSTKTSEQRQKVENLVQDLQKVQDVTKITEISSKTKTAANYDDFLTNSYRQIFTAFAKTALRDSKGEELSLALQAKVVEGLMNDERKRGTYLQRIRGAYIKDTEKVPVKFFDCVLDDHGEKFDYSKFTYDELKELVSEEELKGIIIDQVLNQTYDYLKFGDLKGGVIEATDKGNLKTILEGYLEFVNCVISGIDDKKSIGDNKEVLETNAKFLSLFLTSYGASNEITDSKNVKLSNENTETIYDHAGSIFAEYSSIADFKTKKDIVENLKNYKYFKLMKQGLINQKYDRDDLSKIMGDKKNTDYFSLTTGITLDGTPLTHSGIIVPFLKYTNQYISNKLFEDYKEQFDNISKEDKSTAEKIKTLEEKFQKLRSQMKNMTSICQMLTEYNNTLRKNGKSTVDFASELQKCDTYDAFAGKAIELFIDNFIKNVKLVDEKGDEIKGDDKKKIKYENIKKIIIEKNASITRKQVKDKTSDETQAQTAYNNAKSNPDYGVCLLNVMQNLYARSKLSVQELFTEIASENIPLEDLSYNILTVFKKYTGNTVNVNKLCAEFISTELKNAGEIDDKQKEEVSDIIQNEPRLIDHDQVPPQLKNNYKNLLLTAILPEGLLRHAGTGAGDIDNYRTALEEHVSKIFKAIFNNEKSGIDTTVIRNELKDTCEKTKNNIMDKTGLDNYKAVLESISKLDENKYSTFFSATGEYGEARKQVVEKNSPKSIETLVYMMNLGVKKEIARDLYENATWDDQENNRKIMEDVISFIMNKNIAETLNIEEKDKTDIANRSDNTDKFLQNSLELIFKQALLQEIIITDEGKKIDDETKAAEIAKGMAKNLVSIPNQKERLDAISTYIKEIDQCINTRATIQYSNLIDKTVYKHPDISFNTLQELYGDKEKAKKEVIDNYVSKNAATGKPLVNKKGNLEKVLPEVFDQVFNASKPEPTLTQKGDLLQTLLPEYTTYSLKDEDIENIKKTFELSKEQIEGITEVVGLNTTTDYTEGYKKLDEIIPYVKTDEEKKLFEKDSLSQKAILYLTTDDTASTAGKLNYKNAIEKVKKVSEFTSDDLQKEIFDSDKAGFINKKDDRELVIEYCERIKELEEKGKGLEKAEKTSIKAQTTLKEFYQTTNAVLLKKAMANFIEANNGNAKLGNDNVIVAVTNFVNTNLEKATNTHQAYKNTLSYLTDIIDKGRAVRFDNFISEIEKNIGTTNNFMDSATDDIKKVIENKEEYQKDIVGKIAGQAKYTEYKQTLTELLTNNFNTLVDNTTISSEKIKADYEPLINVILPKDEITSTATKAEDTTNITTILNEIEKQADKKDIINGLTSIFEEIKNNDEIKKSLTEQIANHSTDITKFKKDSIYQKAIVGALKANEKADNLVKNTIDMLDIEMGNLVSDTLKGLLCPADKYNDETTKKQREEALLYCNTINQINNVANRNVEIKGAAINEIKSTVSYTNFKEEATKAIVEAVVYKTITKKDSAGKPQVLSNTDETDKVFVKEIVDKINGLEGTKLQETLSYMLELAQNNVTTTVKPFQMSCSDFIANLKNKGDINIELKGVPYDKAKDILGDDVAKDNAIKELADKNTDKTKNMTAVLNAVFNNKDIVSTDKPQLEIQTPYKEFIEAILPKDDDIKDKDTTKKADDVRKDFATDLVNIFNNLTKGNEKNELDGIQTVVAAVADINKRLEIISNLSVDVNNYALFADNKKKELLKNTAKAGGKISETIKDLQQIRGTTYNVSDELLKTLYPDNETKFKEEKNHRKFVVNALKTLSVANKKGELGVESLDLVKNEKGFDDFQKTIIDTVLGNFLTKYVKVNNGKGGEIDFDCTRTHTAVYNEIKADIKDKLKDDDGTKILNFIKAIDDKCGELGAIGAASNFIRYDDFITKIYVGTIGTKPDISRGIDDALYFDPTKIKEKSYQVYKDKLEKVSTNVRYKDEFGGMSALGFKTIYNNCYDVFSTNTAFQSDEGVKFIADVFDKTKGVYTGGRKSNLGDILRKIFEVDSEVTSEFIKCYSMANAKYKYNQGNKGDVLKKTSEDMNLFDPNKPYAQIIESMITNTNTSFENAVSYATSFKEQEIKKEIIENLFPINSAEYKNKLNERSVVITLLQINEKKSEDLSAANNIKDLMEKMASTIADDISKKLTTNVRGKEGDLETDTQEAIKKVIEENIKKLPDSGDDTEKTYKVLNYYNSIISSKDKINFVDFRNNVTEKLEDIFAGQLKYDTYADIYGAKKAKDDFSEALAEKLKGDGKIKEEEKDKCTEIIKLLFDKVTEDETTSGKRQIKTAYQDFIIAVMPKTSAKYDKEQEDKLLTIVNNIEVIASPDKEVVSKGITEIFKKAKNEEEQEEFIKTISNIDPSKYVEYFKEGTANYQAIQRSIVEGRSLKDTISEVDLMKDKVSDEIKSEIYKDDNSETKAKRFTIITICNTINQIKGDKSGTIDTTELNKKTDLNNFYKEAKKIESNYIVSKLTNKNGNALESSKEPGKNLSEALQELDITVISSLAIQAQKGRISSSKDLQQYDLYVSDYTQSQSLFEVEYINKQVVKHIISGLEYTTYEETQKENLEKILTQNVTPLLSIAESKVVDDYKEFVKVLAPENEKVSDEYLGNLKGLLEKIEKNELAEPSNKEDAITFIANILEKQESLEGLNNTVKQISELSKEQFAKVLENKETVVKLVGDGVPFENANDAIVKAGELHLSKNVIKTLDRESAHSVIELSEIMETASKAPLGVKVEGADVEAKTDVKEVFEIYADAIFDKMAEHVQCKEGKEDNKLSEWGKESVHEDEYKKVKEVFRKKILNLECFNKIKQETNKFEKPITFEKLLEKVDLSGSAEISANIVENITGKKPTLEDTLSKIEELNYSKKSKEVQEIIKGLCANDEIKKQIINEDGQFIDGEQSKIILVNLIKNIPDEKEKAEEYSKNIKTIVKDFTIDALKDIYGDKESKPLTVEVVNDLSKNVADAKTQYNDNKILFKHLIQKEKTVAEIKETSEALEEIIDKSNEKLLQDICKNDKTEEIIKVSKIEESSGLTNLNSEIKSAITSKETWEDVKKTIVEKVIDKKLDILKTEDENFLKGKKEEEVRRVLKEEVLKNEELYETIINKPETIKEIKTHSDFYTKLTPPNTEVSKQVLQNVVLTADQLKNPLIKDNLSDLTKCVNRDLTIKENSVLEIISNFDEEMIQTAKAIEANVGLEYNNGTLLSKNKTVTIKQALQDIVVDAIKINPNSVSDTFKNKMQQIRENLVEYSKDKEHSAEEASKNKLSKIIESIKILQNADNLWNQPKDAKKIQNKEEFIEYLKYKKQFKNEKLLETINKIGDFFDDLKKIKNNKECANVINTIENKIKTLDDPKYQGATELLNSFIEKKKDKLDINDIIDINIQQRDTAEQAQVRMLYHIINKCKTQTEVQEILGDKKLNDTQLKNLAKLVAQDEKPSQLALQILTTPTKEVAEPDDETRKEIINILTSDKSEILSRTQYSLLHSLKNKEEYKDEKLQNFVHNKEIEILENNESLAQVRSIFSLSDTDTIYNSIIDKKLDINSEIGINDLSQSRAYSLKIAELCDHNHNTIIKTYHDFLEKSNKSSIGDDESSKEAIVNVIVSACQEDTKLFTEIMTGDTFTEENKVDLIKGKYLPQRLDCTVVETKKKQQIVVNVENTVENILQDCEQISKETTSPEDKVKNESIFVKGVNEALRYHDSDTIAQICNSIKDNIDIEEETATSLRIKGHLLSEISSRQTEQFDHIKKWVRGGNLTPQRETRSKPILEEKANDEIISNLIDIDKKIYSDDTEKDNYIPSIYHFIESIQDSDIKEKQSKKVADHIISKLSNGDIEAGEVLNILSGCKTADKEEKKSTYNAIIDGLASQAKDENVEQIQNIIKSCVNSVNKEEQDIAVDLYYKISQKQSNNLQKNNFSEQGLNKLLLETPLQTYIEREKKGDYEIITGGLLAKKQNRNVETILEKLNLSPDQIKVYKEQIALLSTPEEIFDLLNGLIKNHNTKIASGLASGHMDLLTSTDRNVIKGEFEKHDLKGLFMGKTSKEREKNKEKLYAELEERASKAGFTEKHEIRGLVKKLKRKEKEFDRARTELTKFASLHLKRAREAAEYIARYNKYNEIINNKEKYSKEERKEARRARKTLAKGNYEFMNHGDGFGRHWRKKKNPIQFIWSIFTRKSKRKLYYAKKDLERSNKALRVVLGVDFVPEFDSKKGTVYTMRTKVKPNPNETTIRSKKLRMIKQHEDAGFWSQLWGGGKARYSQFRELRVHRTGDATAMEGFTEKFIKETSDLRKEAVEILTKKNYYSKSSLGKVKTSDKEELNFIYDTAFGASKDQENENKNKGGRS